MACILAFPGFGRPFSAGSDITGFACEVGFRPVGHTLAGRDSRCASVSFPAPGQACRGKSDEPTFLSAGAGSAGRCQSDHPPDNNIEFHGLAPDPNDPDLT